MAPTIPPPSLLPAGIAPVAAAWGGLLRGRTYLLVGPAAARGRLALGLLRGSAEADTLGLLVSSHTPADLLAAAAEDGFDLATAYRRQHAKLVAAPPAATLSGLNDAGLARTLGDLAGFLRQHRPDRLVIEDFSAFVRFSSFDAFAAAFRTLADAAAAASATLVLGLGEPANASSNRLLLFLQGETAGALHVTPDPEGDLQIALLPGTAHAGDARTVRWSPGAAPVAAAPPPPPEVALDGAYTALETPVARKPAAPEPPMTDYTGFEEDPFAFDPLAESDGAPDSSDGSPHAPDFLVDPPDLSVPPPPGDDDWTPITPIDPAAAPFGAHAERDPLPVDLGPDLLALGHFVDSRTHGAHAPDGDGLGGATASVHHAAYPKLFASIPDEADEAREEGPEEAFRRALADAFAARARTPFLVLALRLDPAGPHADLLAAIAYGLDAALSDDGALFGDPQVGCLITLLPRAGSEAASGLFAAVRAHLHAVAPEHAAEALRAVGALAIPNGEPFASAEELLAYVLGDA